MPHTTKAGTTIKSAASHVGSTTTNALHIAVASLGWHQIAQLPETGQTLAARPRALHTALIHVGALHPGLAERHVPDVLDPDRQIAMPAEPHASRPSAGTSTQGPAARRAFTPTWSYGCGSRRFASIACGNSSNAPAAVAKPTDQSTASSPSSQRATRYSHSSPSRTGAGEAARATCATLLITRSATRDTGGLRASSRSTSSPIVSSASR